MARADVIPTALGKTIICIVFVGSDDARSKYINVCSGVMWMRYSKYEVFPIRNKGGASKSASEQVAVAMGWQ